ncbi:filamin-binding LIM protein 1 [Brienomyrus brachyistius]|uniref:filamin-binding LIM protein 1 n=1 Tax=Brienomyrus brachyistius TaxID=42636 RepID=UPI0020B205CF|nr:filamin-binding LIM protein 1 [Brienomyrus brachyistius]XP_048879132.1 filamin-binding LIM protein 1 [Brienomyrus brachyistius]XP_048879133.1 filamin-binding LIM protein 1 [Brienomyrus brachyistius]
MASAVPQKRMVSSVFITLASPHRATVTPHATLTDSRGSAVIVAGSGKSSHGTPRLGPPTAPKAQTTVPYSHAPTTSQATPPVSHSHAPSTSQATPPVSHSHAPSTSQVTPPTSHGHTPTPKAPPPTQSKPRFAPSIVPPPPPSSPTLTTPKQPSHSAHQGALPPSLGSGLPFMAHGQKAPLDRESPVEDIPPPPPPPPPFLGAEPSADAEPPLPPPPPSDPLPPPPLPVSQCEAPLSSPQMKPVPGPQYGEMAPPAGQSQNNQTPRNEDLKDDAEGKDVCGFCRKPVALSEAAIEALNRTYHAGCFQCRQCFLPLAGQLYYNKAGIPLCEACYQASLEQCWACGETIKEQVMRALGRAYHPPCFVCSTCNWPLGEERFAQGEVGEVYCLADYYRKYAPCCSACQQLIVPADDGRDSYTVECLGQTFHEDCYRCETCQVLLSPEPNDQGCYPLDGRMLCKPCHLTLVQGSQG